MENQVQIRDFNDHKNKNDLKISIITVCLNCVKTIEQTIKSVVSQKYSNIEYIIIDGGSTDGTLDIIERYQQYITFWISEPDRGIYDAMNKGVNLASGDIVAFLNADDWYCNNAIQYVMSDIMNDNASIICYDDNVHYGNSTRVWRHKLVDHVDNIRIDMLYCHQTIFAERRLFLKYGNFNIKYAIAADYDWILRMYNNGEVIKHKNFVVVNFRYGGISSSQILKAKREVKAISLEGLNRLKEHGKVSENYYIDLQNRIFNYHKKMELNCVSKLAINDFLVVGNIEVKKKLEKILNSSHYSIFGCGELGEECYMLLKQLNLTVDCFWDNNLVRQGTYYDGIEIRNPEKIVQGETNIIISTCYHSDEIKKQLRSMKLDEKEYIDYEDIRQRVGMEFMNHYY
ncbi:MAG: glycosyltransferase [Lachnospiraceae bacterium]|nr:glycosyltransferase [Lachnospiraceae bacterium]